MMLCGSDWHGTVIGYIRVNYVGEVTELITTHGNLWLQQKVLSRSFIYLCKYSTDELGYHGQAAASMPYIYIYIFICIFLTWKWVVPSKKVSEDLVCIPVESVSASPGTTASKLWRNASLQPFFSKLIISSFLPSCKTSS